MKSLHGAEGMVMVDRTRRNGGECQSVDQDQTSLFERYAWVYAFCREHLFRDDTRQIALALWPEALPPDDYQILELGCGPGFYACQLAEQFGQLRVTGIDSAEQQLRRARRRAAERSLVNCRFEHADVGALSQANASVDGLIAARLFTVVDDREQALAEMYRVLRPGGRCFLAEPRSPLRALLPLAAMWFLALLSRLGHTRSAHYREPRRVTILSIDAFGTLAESQPWHAVSRWHDARYQYALCEKGAPHVVLQPVSTTPVSA